MLKNTSCMLISVVTYYNLRWVRSKTISFGDWDYGASLFFFSVTLSCVALDALGVGTSRLVTGHTHEQLYGFDTYPRSLGLYQFHSIPNPLRLQCMMMYVFKIHGLHYHTVRLRMAAGEDSPLTKKRITISIDEGLLNWIDEEIERSNYLLSDRSHVITVAVAEYRKKQAEKK